MPRAPRPLACALLLATLAVPLTRHYVLPPTPTSLAWAASNPPNDFTLTDPDEGKPLAAPPARPVDTFAHRALDLESEETPVSPAKYALLDSIIAAAKSRITNDPTLRNARSQRQQATRILNTIDAVLTEHNVLYPPGDYDVQSLRLALSPQRFDRPALDDVLRVGFNQRRREHARAHAAEPFHVMDCDMTSFVYLAVADACNLPLALVDLPDHMFVRWTFPDGSHLNWDTNDAESIDDREYARDYDLGKKLRRRRIYLASMTRRESEGFLYHLRAGRYEERDQFAQATADLERALELYPQSTMIQGDLAWRYAVTKDATDAHRKRALDLARQIVKLEPQSADFWETLAAAHAANGDHDRAVTCARKAETLAPTPQDRGQYRATRKTLESRRPITGR